MADPEILGFYPKEITMDITTKMIITALLITAKCDHRNFYGMIK